MPKKRFEIVFNGLMLAVVIEIALTAFQYMMINKEISVLSGRLFMYSSYVSISAVIFASSFCEGIFLYVLFIYLEGKNVRLKGALESAMGVFPSLLVFNLVFYFLFSRNYPRFISHGVTWLPAIIIFMTPFIISKEGIPLKEALKKNLRIVYKIPVDYFVMIVVLCVAAWLINYAMYLFSHYFYQPLFVKTSIPYYLWITPYQILADTIFIWFSLFSFCVVGAFVHEVSYKLFSGKIKLCPE